MKFRSVIGSCFIMAFFSACQQAEIENWKSDDLRLSIVASINNRGIPPDSRYAGTSPDAVDFVQGDEIGLFVRNGSATCWTYGSEGWGTASPVYWPNVESDCTFYAFYPYVAADDLTAVPMPNLSLQNGSLGTLGLYDFLATSVTQSYGETGVVDFTGNNAFKHVSSLVQMTILATDDLKPSELTRISITGRGLVSSSTYSFKTNTVSVTSSEEADVLSIEPSFEESANEGNCYFILNGKEDASVVTLRFEYVKNNKTYVAEVENFSDNQFLPGTKQGFTVEINNGNVSISGSSITEWSGNEEFGEIEITGEEAVS